MYATQNQDARVSYMAIERASYSEKLDKSDKATIPALIKSLDDKSQANRGAAIYALGSMGSKAKAAKPKLVEILQNKQESDENRANAGMALGEMGKDALSAVPILVKILENKLNPQHLTISAALALDKIDCQTLIPILVKRLGNKNFASVSLNILNNIASKSKEGKNISDAELVNVISEFETALEVINKSGNSFPQDKIKSLQESVVALKNSIK
ncbi:MAG: HEAT repeat domain-containing protein [Cyanobacteriota bacterium]|nr:HEAT repeat domain-containing protein [Cyanobacteriota bacterium]